MNRKARRAARHQEQRTFAAPVLPAALSDPRQLFDAACQHHQAGRAGDAVQLYHRVLSIDPAHFKSLQNLGAIALNAQRADMAADFFRRALAVNEQSPEVHCNLAIALNEVAGYGEAIDHSRRAIALNPKYVWPYMTLARALWMQGQLTEAVANYRRALELKPDHAEGYAYLGNLLLELSRFDEAQTCLERAIKLNPSNPQMHIWLGDLHVAKGDSAGSLDCYVRAMELKPDHLMAHYSFGTALMSMSRYDAIVEYYENFLQIQPTFVHGYNLLARAYNDAGNPLKGLETVRRGLKIEETPQGKNIFVECLSHLGTFPGMEIKDLIARAISEPWARPMTLARHCVAVIEADPEIGACIARAQAAWPARLNSTELFGTSGLKSLSSDKLLLAYLANSRVVDLHIEKFVTALRFAMLDRACSTGADADENELAFCCAIARQCFVSEYALLHDSAELALVGALRDSLTASLNASISVSPLKLAALGAYYPLHSLPGAEKLLARSWSQPLEDLLTQQVREPMQERALRASIPAITPIKDGISVAVRDQYEHNPYPRWVAAQPSEVSSSINSYVRARFPNAEFHQMDTEGRPSLLVAGCGTGQSLVDYCRLAGGHTLAIDLSLTSLSYAKRKIGELGLQNIEFAQADILELGSINRTFDVINCGGVLHHLGDPNAGWRVLLSLLKPNGFMSVALYSEVARANYVAAQKMIVERGYGSSPEEIRRFRGDLIAGETSAMRTGVIECPDFYSLSECRDLLFHVQEHRITIPELRALFEANGLRFIGFEVDARVRLAYAQRFPDDSKQDNLDNWHVFEQENPSTFGAMYAFWVQKGGPAATTAS